MESLTSIVTRSRAKGENSKYIRDNHGDKMNPIMEIKANEGEEPYLCDIVFSFDTTGSMRSVIQSVRANLSETVDRLFKEIPGIRIGIIVHGDYCDFPNMFWKLNLTRDIDVIHDFINGAPDTSGGDYPECYELVLKTAYDMNWKSEVKVLVVIGDALPHEKGYRIPSRESNNMIGISKPLDIDWREETKRLKEKDVVIFSCQALPESNDKAIEFYATISSETNGFYLTLNELQSFKDYMVAICMRVADGAEDLQLIQERQEELKKQVEEIKKKHEERERLEKERRELEEKIRSERDEERRKQFLEQREQISSSIVSGYCDLDSYKEETMLELTRTNDVMTAAKTSKGSAFTSKSFNHVASEIRKNKNMKKRSEQYEEECLKTNKTSMNSLFSKLNDSSLRVPDSESRPDPVFYSNIKRPVSREPKGFGFCDEEPKFHFEETAKYLNSNNGSLEPGREVKSWVKTKKEKIEESSPNPKKEETKGPE